MSILGLYKIEREIMKKLVVAIVVSLVVVLTGCQSTVPLEKKPAQPYQLCGSDLVGCV
jgi:predicted component of type VI protein secretion system